MNNCNTNYLNSEKNTNKNDSGIQLKVHQFSHGFYDIETSLCSLLIWVYHILSLLKSIKAYGIIFKVGFLYKSLKEQPPQKSQLSEKEFFSSHCSLYEIVFIIVDSAK